MLLDNSQEKLTNLNLIQTYSILVQSQFNIPKLTRDDVYIANYPDFDFTYNMVLCLKNTLINSTIEKQVRAKMVDWTLEVLSHFQNGFSVSTFFRSILIFDHFVKYSQLALSNTDVHLIGIACMYIATKYEDLFFIRLTDFSNKASHGRYSCDQIQHAEMLILSECTYCISFKTYSEIIDFYFAKMFRNKTDNEIHARLKNQTTTLLIFCVHSVELNNFDYRLVAISCILLAIKYLKNHCMSQAIEVILREKKEYDKLESILAENVKTLEMTKDVLKEVKIIGKEIVRFCNNFELEFPELGQAIKITRFDNQLRDIKDI